MPKTLATYEGMASPVLVTNELETVASEPINNIRLNGEDIAKLKKRYNNADPKDMARLPGSNKDKSYRNGRTNNIAEQLVASQFLDTPSQETLNDIIPTFINATGNEALKTMKLMKYC